LKPIHHEKKHSPSKTERTKRDRKGGIARGQELLQMRDARKRRDESGFSGSYSLVKRPAPGIADKSEETILVRHKKGERMFNDFREVKGT